MTQTWHDCSRTGRNLQRKLCNFLISMLLSKEISSSMTEIYISSMILSALIHLWYWRQFVVCSLCLFLILANVMLFMTKPSDRWNTNSVFNSRHLTSLSLLLYSRRRLQSKHVNSHHGDSNKTVQNGKVLLEWRPYTKLHPGVQNSENTKLAFKFRTSRRIITVEWTPERLKIDKTSTDYTLYKICCWKWMVMFCQLSVARIC